MMPEAPKASLHDVYSSAEGHLKACSDFYSHHLLQLRNQLPLVPPHKQLLPYLRDTLKL